MDAVCLVDFDNLPQRLRNAGLVPLARYLEQAVQKASPNPGDITVRLYGGWYSASGLSNSGSLLTQEIARDFPLVTPSSTRIIRRIHCEIASSLIDNKSQLLGWTYRRRSGIRSRLTNKRPADCAAPNSCTLEAVVRWSRGRCPDQGCPVTVQNAFTYNEQKLVDTLLCCDILALCRRTPKVAIFVLSDDDDLLPALLMGTSDGGLVWKCRMKPNPGTHYDSLLSQSSVSLIDI